MSGHAAQVLRGSLGLILIGAAVLKLQSVANPEVLQTFAAEVPRGEPWLMRTVYVIEGILGVALVCGVMPRTAALAGLLATAVASYEYYVRSGGASGGVAKRCGCFGSTGTHASSGVVPLWVHFALYGAGFTLVVLSGRRTRVVARDGPIG